MKKNFAFRTIAVIMALIMLLSVGTIFAFAETKPNFKPYLSPDRIAVDPPESLVDENGKARFGTFNSEIKNINLEDIKGQSEVFPDSLNFMRLTKWEALEVDTKDFTLLAAIQEIGGVAAVNMTLLFVKAEQKMYSWVGAAVAGDQKIAANLYDGNQTYVKSAISSMTINNDFNNGRASGNGSAIGLPGTVQYQFDLKRVSKPSVIVCPFGENKPLYTQKDLFASSGYLNHH